MSQPSHWPAPWQLPHAQLPHSALPLGNGWWRGPRIQQAYELGAWGLAHARPLPDGSVAYRPLPGLTDRLVRELPPDQWSDSNQLAAHSTQWVAARIVCAARAHARTPHSSQWMAILNLTPDSFSDGGQLDQLAQVVERAQQTIRQGAAWLDLGAESTRPGAQAVSSQQQLDRLLPALDAVQDLSVKASVDTRCPTVAEACLRAGAHAVNDVSGLNDPRMAEVIAAHDAEAFVMHMRGTPTDMQEHCQYDFLLGEVADEWMQRAHHAIRAGANPQSLHFDPGIGFAKTARQSQQLLAHIGCFRALGFPMLVGPSRKSFLADLLPPDRLAPDRDCGTAGAAASCILQGVEVIRLHVGEFWDAARVAAGIARAKTSLAELDFTRPL